MFPSCRTRFRRTPKHKPSHVRRMEASSITSKLETVIGHFFKPLPCDPPTSANWRTLWLADGGYFYVFTKPKAKVCSKAFTTETFYMEARPYAEAFNVIESLVILGQLQQPRSSPCRGFPKIRGYRVSIGFPKIRGYHFWGPHSTGYSVLGSILGSPVSGKLLC